MVEQDIDLLMDYSTRDLAYAQRLLDEGAYPKSVNESYYAAFYAAKAGLLYLGVRTKSHQSLALSIDDAVAAGRLPPEMRGVLQLLLNLRNEAVYRYARQDWSKEEALYSLQSARRKSAPATLDLTGMPPKTRATRKGASPPLPLLGQ